MGGGSLRISDVYRELCLKMSKSKAIHIISTFALAFHSFSFVSKFTDESMMITELFSITVE